MEKPKLTIEELKAFHKKVFGFERDFKLGSVLAGKLENIYFKSLQSRQYELNHTFFCPKCKSKLEVSFN